MKNATNNFSRLSFIKNTAVFTAGAAGTALYPETASSMYNANDNINIIGPQKGFSPHVGALLSMMTWMRAAIMEPVKNMTIKQLDYLHDEKANTIGAMLLHLAATEKYYQLHTFEGTKWGSWDDAVKKKWDIPMSLGEEARKTIKGNNLNYYLDTLTEIREKTIAEFKKQDDEWLMTVDKEWS